VRRLLVVLVTALVVVWPAAAFAHEEITPNVIATGKPTFFMLSAANEKKVDLVSITLKAPDGVPFGETTKEPPGWKVDKSEDSITWSGGTVKPDAFESWGFEIEGADQPGTLSYNATLKFADGTSDDVKINVTAQSAADGGVVSAKTVSNAKSRANTATLLAWVALAAAIVAMLLAVLGRRGSSGEQNW